MRRILFILFATLAIVPAVAQAQTFEPAVMLHIDAPVTKAVCGTFVAPDTCTTVTTNAAASAGTQYNVYILAATGGGLVDASFAAVQFSIVYTTDTNNFALLSWATCADQEFAGPNWGSLPSSGASNSLIFDSLQNCQTQPIVVCGFFIVGAYGDAMMGIGPNSASGTLKVANCSSAEEVIDNNRGGIVGFGATAGCNPCINPDGCTVPVKSSTWGGIKRQFEGE